MSERLILYCDEADMLNLWREYGVCGHLIQPLALDEVDPEVWAVVKQVAVWLKPGEQVDIDAAVEDEYGRWMMLDDVYGDFIPREPLDADFVLALAAIPF